jgi:hypothetical protein
MGDKRECGKRQFFIRLIIMKKLQPGDEIVKIDEELGIAWILLPPDTSLGGFRGISPRVMDEKKFIAAKKKSEKEKG